MTQGRAGVGRNKFQWILFDVPMIAYPRIVNLSLFFAFLACQAAMAEPCLRYVPRKFSAKALVRVLEPSYPDVKFTLDASKNELLAEGPRESLLRISSYLSKRDSSYDLTETAVEFLPVSYGATEEVMGLLLQLVPDAELSVPRNGLLRVEGPISALLQLRELLAE